MTSLRVVFGGSSTTSKCTNASRGSSKCPSGYWVSEWSRYLTAYLEALASFSIRGPVKSPPETLLNITAKLHWEIQVVPSVWWLLCRGVLASRTAEENISSLGMWMEWNFKPHWSKLLAKNDPLQIVLAILVYWHISVGILARIAPRMYQFIRSVITSWTCLLQDRFLLGQYIVSMILKAFLSNSCSYKSLLLNPCFMNLVFIPRTWMPL